MEEVIKLFKQIQETSSLNDKKKVIAANKNNKLFKKCLRFLLDGNIVTGINTKKINKKVVPSSELAPYHLCVYSTFEDVMDYLEKNNTGKMKIFMRFRHFCPGMRRIEIFMNK